MILKLLCCILNRGDDVELRNLKTFLMVANTQNFTRAAKEMGYSQSNISAQIAQLEEEIGAPLFNRAGKRISLTQCGEELLPYAREICSLTMKMETLQKSNALLGGTVRIGLTDSISELFLEDALLAFHRRFPNVKAEVALDTAQMLLERLRHGELDAACVIADPLPMSEWVIWKEYDAPVVAASHPGMEICGSEPVSIEDLAKEKLVLTETEASYSKQFEQELAARHLDCDPVFRLQSTQMALRMVERGEFIAVLPLYAVREAVKDGRAVLLNIPEWKKHQAIQILLHRSKFMTPQISGLLEELKRVLDNVLSCEG